MTVLKVAFEQAGYTSAQDRLTEIAKEAISTNPKNCDGGPICVWKPCYRCPPPRQPTRSGTATSPAERASSGLTRDNDARRVMMKAVIEDLWRVWNGKEPLIR